MRTFEQAVALQQVLADLQGAPCGGEPAAGESEGAACNRIALSGELLWLAVAGYADTNDITAADDGRRGGRLAARGAVRSRRAEQGTRRARRDARRPLRARAGGS